MPDSPYLENAHDYEVRFLECWGVMDDKIIYPTSFIDKSNGDVITRYHTLSRSDESSLNYQGNLFSEFFKETDEIPFDNDIFTLPKLGFINHRFFTLYFERRHKKSSPSRYRRGFRSDTVNILNPSMFELDRLYRDSGNPNPFREHSEIIFHNSAYDLFFPKFFSYQEALELVLSGKRLAAAITPTIAIQFDYSGSSIVLMKNTWKVGDYDPSYKCFLLRTSIFNEDFADAGVKFR